MHRINIEIGNLIAGRVSERFLQDPEAGTIVLNRPEKAAMAKRLGANAQSPIE